MLGHQFFATVPDIDRTDYFLMLGTNPKISNGAMMSTGANVHKKLNAIRERGGKTVLIDPRRNETAPYCDEHHFIKPNTDALLLMGLIKSVIDNQLADLGRLAPDIVGFDQIEVMIKGFELGDIAAVTGISVETIERLARIRKRRKGGLLRTDWGVDGRVWRHLPVADHGTQHHYR